MTFHVPENYRITRGLMASSAADGNNGYFIVPAMRSTNWTGAQSKVKFCVVASDGLGWEHVSVSLTTRCPKWEEMCDLKDLFWDADDCIVQFHPPKSEYVNNHPFCLHMWRSIDVAMPRPPSLLVGIAA